MRIEELIEPKYRDMYKYIKAFDIFNNGFKYRLDVPYATIKLSGEWLASHYDDYDLINELIYIAMMEHVKLKK